MDYETKGQEVADVWQTTADLQWKKLWVLKSFILPYNPSKSGFF